MSVHKLIVGARESPLAKIQVEEVRALLAGQGFGPEWEFLGFQTKGDKDKKTSLTVNPADDFFTDALDQALLDKKVDVTVHSAKDLPQQIRPGLKIVALTRALDETDALVGKNRLADLKPGARIGTSSALRAEQIKALCPHVKTVDIRGTIQERLKMLEEGKYDGIIIATCALKRLGLADRITEVLPWEATPLQGQLAVVARENDADTAEIFAAIDVRRSYGKVILAGAGPGDPELITVKALKALRKADCVFYDYLINKQLLDHAPFAEKIYVGKRKGKEVISQEELCRLLRRKALAGKTVVRLKGGDPLIFGRGADEMSYLRGFYIPVEVIPGVTSATGIPASLGIPLTARGVASSVAFVSGHEQGERHAPKGLVRIPEADTVVFLMGLTKLDVICRSLLKAGWKRTTPVMVIAKGTMLDELIIKGTVADIEERVVKAKPGQPALIIAGNTVDWWRPGAQGQCRILYLGTNPDKYKPLGRIVHLPMISIAPIQLAEADVKQLIGQLPSYDMILLTSRYAVHYFFDLLQREGLTAHSLQQCDFAAVGQDTAFVMEQYGVRARFIPAEETGVGMVAALAVNCDLKGKKILFPRSALPNPYIKEELTKQGAAVTELAIYTNTKPEKRELPADPADKILFTSPSTVRNFLQDYGQIPANLKILSKGPKTAEALQAAGYVSEILVFE